MQTLDNFTSIEICQKSIPFYLPPYEYKAQLSGKPFLILTRFCKLILYTDKESTHNFQNW